MFLCLHSQVLVQLSRSDYAEDIPDWVFVLILICLPHYSCASALPLQWQFAFPNRVCHVPDIFSCAIRTVCYYY